MKIVPIDLSGIKTMKNVKPVMIRELDDSILENETVKPTIQENKDKDIVTSTDVDSETSTRNSNSALTFHEDEIYISDEETNLEEVLHRITDVD